MNDVEGIDHEIMCAMYEASRAFDEAKLCKFYEERPGKTMAEIGEAIEKLIEAQKFLLEAARLQRDKCQQEAA